MKVCCPLSLGGLFSLKSVIKDLSRLIKSSSPKLRSAPLRCSQCTAEQGVRGCDRQAGTGEAL